MDRINTFNIFKEQLQKMYLEDRMTMGDIAKIFNCSITTISQNFKRYNIKSRYIAPAISKEELFDLYWNKSMSMPKIAEKFKCSYTAIYNIMEKYSIKCRKSGVPKGCRFSEEHCRKLSELNKGENNPNYGKEPSKETRKKMSLAKKGKKLSEETKKKMSESLKGKVSPMKGKHHSEETKKRLSETHKGKNHYMYGKTHSEEYCKKMSLATKGKNIKENSSNWKGGITPEYLKVRNSMGMDIWRKQVYERDNYTCQKCGMRGGHLNAHPHRKFFFGGNFKIRYKQWNNAL